MKLFTVVVTTSLMLLGLTACGKESTALKISDPWIRLNGASAAGYMEIKNTGSTDDALLSVDASGIKVNSVELHETFRSEDSAPRSGPDGQPMDTPAPMMGMRQVQQISIGKGETVKLAPGGYHIMFMGLSDSPAEGTKVNLTLHFKESRDQKVTAIVKNA